MTAIRAGWPEAGDADAMPGAAFLTMPGAHFHRAANPEKFAGIVRRFVTAAADRGTTR